MDRTSNARGIDGTNGGAQGRQKLRPGRSNFGKSTGNTLGLKWAALQDAANAVATIAGGAPEIAVEEVRHFPLAIREAGGWRLRHAEQGIEDLTSIMEPGLTALLAALARGANPQAAALALWNEYIEARNALLELLPPNRHMGRRTA
ncbi:hypothetical protein [Novosphingobium sp. PP1Y]|uniref:hypothetical protein n=1 Tax=Novosphingobium sp. PP1Y TaxID=702113 RepID=UPI00020EF377|nr:hypothetical protein [Novosphingobium sp. PP1Y]CCA94365.1 conserved hypothetical protein [Novosphingobium sp. PP1Y]